MDTLPELRTGRWVALAAPRAGSETMLVLTAHLAAHGPVRVLDAGNRFNAYPVARLLRRLQGAALEAALERIRVARAFTCYQVQSLLEGTYASTAPTLVIDLLQTFYDESVDLDERCRLLDRCLGELRRLSRQAGVAVSLRPPRPPQTDPTGLLDTVLEAADQVYWLGLPPPAEPAPLRLLPDL